MGVMALRKRDKGNQGKHGIHRGNSYRGISTTTRTAGKAAESSNARMRSNTNRDATKQPKSERRPHIFSPSKNVAGGERKKKRKCEGKLVEVVLKHCPCFISPSPPCFLLDFRNNTSVSSPFFFPLPGYM